MSKHKLEVERINGEIIRRGPYPEFTWTAVIVGWFLGILIAISISYAALKPGFSIEGSELAAILGWGILRGLMGRTSILENKINQTIASAVNGASSGIMFTLPALFILSRKPGPETLADDLRIFGDGRGSIVAEHGLQKFADVMSKFAAGERTIHRTWSAAADGYLDEAAICIERALMLRKKAAWELDNADGNGRVS